MQPYQYIDYSRVEGKDDIEKISRLAQLDPVLLERINKASTDYFNRTGKKLPINSAVRLYDEQENLSKNAGKTGISSIVANPAGQRDKLFHTNAVDISPGEWDKELTKYQLHRPIKNDIVHVMATPQAKTQESTGGDWFDNPTAYVESKNTAPISTTTEASNGGDWFENPTPYSNAKSTLQSSFQDKKEVGTKLAEKFATKFAPNLIPDEAKPVIKDLGKNVASFLDNTIGGVMPYGAKQIGYIFGRTIGDSPETAEKISNRMASIVDKPFGKAFGISDDPVYKGEATGKLMQFVGENVGKGSTWISQKTGLPKSDIEWMINTALPKVTEVVAKPVVQNVAKAEIGATEGIKSQFNKMKTEAEAKLGGVSLQDQFNAKQKATTAQTNASAQSPRTFDEFISQAAKDGLDVTSPDAVEAMQRIWEEQKPTGAPSATQAPKATVEVIGAPEVIEQATINGHPTELHVTPEVPEMPKSAFSPEEIANREQIMRDVGFTSVRKSALEGNPKEASSQYITAKSEQGVYGEGMTNQLNHEKQALTSYLEGAEKKAGGIVPKKESLVDDKIAGGKVIKDELESAKKDHEADTKTLYKEAEIQHGEKPVDLTDFSDYLKNDSNFIKAEQQNFQKVVNAELKRRGFTDSEGNIRPLTVKEAEGIRKFLNEKYDYEWGNQAVGLKKAIDTDVFRDVQGETYQKARAHFGEGKEMFENPKAMKDLLADEGVNQKIADEQVMQKISKLPESQFEHLFSTLGEKGKIKAQDQIRTSLINEIKEAGQSALNEPWNQPAASKRYSELQRKFRIAFADKPELLADVQKALLAGDISYVPNKYPGAAVQTHLLHTKFGDIALSGGTAAGAAVGGTIGGPVGAAIGSVVGAGAGKTTSGFLNKRNQQKALEKEIKSDGKSSLQDIYNLKD